MKTYNVVFLCRYGGSMSFEDHLTLKAARKLMTREELEKRHCEIAFLNYGDEEIGNFGAVDHLFLDICK